MNFASTYRILGHEVADGTVFLVEETRLQREIFQLLSLFMQSSEFRGVCLTSHRFQAPFYMPGVASYDRDASILAALVATALAVDSFPRGFVPP